MATADLPPLPPPPPPPSSTLLGLPATLWWLIGFAAVICGGAAAAVVVADRSVGHPPDREDAQAAAALVSVTAATAFVAVGVWLACVLALLARRLARTADWFGPTPWTRLIGLGVVALLFAETVRKVVGVTTPALHHAWAALPDALSRVTVAPAPAGTSPPTQPERRAPALKQVVEEVSRRLESVWGTLVGDFPLAEVIQALAVWAVIGWVLRSLRESGSAPGQSTTRQNAALFGLIAAALYLSVGAIAAVPALRDLHHPTAPTEQTLKTELDRLILTDEEFNRQFPETLPAPADPFAALKLRVAPKPDPAPEGGEKLPDVVVAVVRKAVKATEDRRLALLTTWQNRRSEIRRESLNLSGTAVRQFSGARGVGNGRVELAQYQQSLQVWCQGSWDQLRFQLQDDYATVTRNHALAEVEAKWYADGIEAALREMDAVQRGARLGTIEKDLDEITSRDLGRTQGMRAPVALFTRSAPEAPAPGSNLGPFKFFAGWLVQTRQQSLALIIGMLGFGLLGSAVSTLVREQATRRADDPLVKDLGGVVLRGLSAAVILFLAVVGGLAVLETGAVEPNPYVLFLGCLVGAVFSQEVWEWARDKLMSQLKANGSGNNGGASPPSPNGGPTAPPGTPPAPPVTPTPAPPQSPNAPPPDAVPPPAGSPPAGPTNRTAASKLARRRVAVDEGSRGR